MGQWNTNGSSELPVPKTPDQKILHLADFLASRKDINLEFDEVYFDDTSADTTCENEKESE
jgi:hypothetical protein